MRNALLLCLIAACNGVTPVPDPPEPPEPPAPVQDGGLPYPDSACGRACARLEALGCASHGGRCVEACERFSELAAESPALSWSPECVANSATCEDAERCRQ